MSMTKKDAAVHRVTIQQVYRMKDTSEERILEVGAIRAGKVVEQVEYYDTDLYDLAVKEIWLSKTGNKWQLIVGKGGQEMSDVLNKHENGSQNNNRSKTREPKTLKFNAVSTNSLRSPIPSNSANEIKQRAPAGDPNRNTELGDSTSRSAMTCYALVEEKAIIAYLSRVLDIAEETDNMGDVLRVANIQKYVSVSYSTQEDFLVRDIYSVQVKADGVSAMKTAVISLEVDIENVTQGFQRLERLANELDLQLQSV